MKRIFRNILFYSLVLNVMALSSCQKDEEFSSLVVNGPKPTASFTCSTGSLTVTFTNNSTNGESYYWQFGDGTTSTQASPVHTYSSAGYYTVILKTNSAAGYSSTVSKPVAAASGNATVDFTTTVPNDLSMGFDATSSSNIASLKWDFGDGSTSTDLNLKFMHQFPVSGTYTVKLKIYGFFNDSIEKTQTITVSGAGVNLLKGGDLESGDSQYWSVWSSQNDNPPVFGYTGDKPIGSGGWGCLRFPSYTNWSGGTNQTIYQAVNVVAGKKYKLSAVVKAPAGGYQDYLQFHISTDPGTWNESTTYFLCLNNWHEWGVTSSYTTAVNGDLYTATLSNGKYGLGVATGGVYTATKTGTVYIGIQCGVWGGKSNGDILVDNVDFEQIN